jgi:thiol-disulfide isomerase/thioredoxin
MSCTVNDDLFHLALLMRPRRSGEKKEMWMRDMRSVLVLPLIAAVSVAAEPLKIGRQVADFERPDSAGKSVKLTEVLKDSKAVVIDFWSSRCPVSEKYEPVLKRLAADYGAKGVAFLGIDSNYNEPAPEVQKIRGDRSVGIPVLMDGQEGTLATYFGASHTPEAYLITKDGVLAYHGNLDEIGGALDAVLAGKPVPKAETRAFGCSIKRP